MIQLHYVYLQGLVFESTIRHRFTFIYRISKIFKNIFPNFYLYWKWPAEGNTTTQNYTDSKMSTMSVHLSSLSPQILVLGSQYLQIFTVLICGLPLSFQHLLIDSGSTITQNRTKALTAADKWSRILIELGETTSKCSKDFAIIVTWYMSQILLHVIYCI